MSSYFKRIKPTPSRKPPFLRSSRALRPAFPVVEPGASHAFAEAAFFDEVFFQAANQLIEEVVGLMDQTDGDICKNVRRAIREKWAVGLIGLIVLRAELADIRCFAGVFVPLGEVAHAE